MTNCSTDGVLRRVFSYGNQQTLADHNRLSTFALHGSPVLATAVVACVAIMTAPPLLNIVNAHRDGVRIVIAVLKCAAFALIFLLTVETFDRIDCARRDDHHSRTSDSEPSPLDDLEGMQYIFYGVWCSLLVIQMADLSCRSSLLAPAATWLASVGLFVSQVLIGRRCPRCAWPLFPLQLVLSSTGLLCLLVHPFHAFNEKRRNRLERDRGRPTVVADDAYRGRMRPIVI